MIDSLRAELSAAQKLDTLSGLAVRPGSYGVVTLHRPSNVDAEETLRPLLATLAEVSATLPLVLALHPRTAERIDRYKLGRILSSATGIRVTGPLPYLPFLALTSQAKVIVTDSGGLQEESTVLGIPCLTMRANTERPITVEMGTSTLVGNDLDLLQNCCEQVMAGTYKRGSCPPLWDGHAAERIATVLTAN
jgi:UDP-N-acetylglucosamine 2-epimerase (non-hydrolysing)